MSLFTSTAKEHVYDRYGYWIVLALIVLLPLAVWVSTDISSLVTKAAVGGVLVLFALAAFSIGVIRAQVLSVPRALLLFAVWLVPLAYGISTLFASTQSTSAFGTRLSMDSFAFMLIGATLMSLVALVFNTQKRTLGAYLALVGTAALVSVVELVLFFGREWIAQTGAIFPSLSVLGTLNDLAVFYGLIVIFVLLSLLLLPITRIVRGVLWLVMLASLYFSAVVNLTVLWWIVGLFALGVLVFSVSAGLFGGEKRLDISFAALLAVVTCAFFVMAPVTLTGTFANWAQVGELEVRPSWSSTINIGRTVLADQSMFGAGPGSFERLWSAHMPAEIANTEFWQANFSYGIGLIPTSVITTGLFGAVAWLVFLGLFLWQGLRSLVIAHTARKGDLAHYMRMTSFVAALYLWIVVFIQVPSPALLLYAFLFTGIFVASLSFGIDTVPSYRLVFKDNAQVGFLVTLCCTVAVLMSIGGMYGFASRFLAEKAYQDGSRVLAQEGDLDAAERAFTRALSLHPADTYYRVLSSIDIARLQELIQQGRRPEEIKEEVQTLLARAIGNAQKATELGTGNYQNWLNLGTIYQTLPIGIDGAEDSAVAAYERVLALRPSAPAVYLAMANIERARGDSEKARAHVERAISLRNRYPEAIFFLAQMQLEENDTENAIKSVQAITMIQPENPIGFFQLGLLYYGSNDFVRAAQSFEQAVSLASEYANARYFLGLTYWRLGDPTRAQSEFERVQATNPDNAEVRAILSNLRAGKPPFEPVTTAETDIQQLDGLPIQNGESLPLSTNPGSSGEVAP